MQIIKHLLKSLPISFSQRYHQRLSFDKWVFLPLYKCTAQVEKDYMIFWHILKHQNDYDYCMIKRHYVKRMTSGIFLESLMYLPTLYEHTRVYSVYCYFHSVESQKMQLYDKKSIIIQSSPFHS